jgi:hypothetical protein
MTIRWRPKRSLSLVIRLPDVAGSPVLPPNTWNAIGHPAAERQKPEHDLYLVIATVPRMVKARQLTAACFDITRTHVVEHQGAVAQMPTPMPLRSKAAPRQANRARRRLPCDRVQPKRHAERVDAVVASRARAIASLVAGSSSHATISARANLRPRSGPSGKSSSSPIRRAVPNAAVTCVRQRPHDLQTFACRNQLVAAQCSP